MVGFFATFLFLLILLPIIIGSSFKPEITRVKDNSVLKINLRGVAVEHDPSGTLEKLFANPRGKLSLSELFLVLKHASTDSKIKGVFLNHGNLTCGFGLAQDLRDLLKEFKEGGKFVYSYGEILGEMDYFLASVADTIVVQPEGFVEFNGFQASITFWKGLLDKLEIRPEIFRAGEYKSFVEPFIRKDMSPESREQITELIESLYSVYLGNIEESRGISAAQLSLLADSLKVQGPESAVSMGLIDMTGHLDDAYGLVRKQLDMDVDKKDKIPFISPGDYLSHVRASEADSENVVAILVAQGPIVNTSDGDWWDQSLGQKFIKTVRKLREREDVKSVVLRINSPGGSMMVSENIHKELKLLSEQKNMIGSFSSVAASGGYYLAMPCDTLVAQPNSITGSIGVFAILFEFEKFLNNKLGITVDVARTSDHADMFGGSRPMDSVEKKYFQGMVDRAYDVFLGKVAESRGMSKEEVDAVGSGRVWTGQAALEKGLVDVLGNLSEAVRISTEMAQIQDDFRVEFHPDSPTLPEELELFMKSGAKAGDVVQELGLLIGEDIDAFRELTSMHGIQARMPMKLRVR